MDLLTNLRVISRWLVKTTLPVGLSLVLFGCAAAPKEEETVPPESEQVPTEQAVVETETPPEEKVYLPLSPEVMYYVLTAEIAGQRGEMGIAVDLYHRASELVDSPMLASRSAQVATYSRDRQRINRALERWVQVEPEAADVHVMQLPFLMLNGDYAGVVQSVNKAIELSPDDAPQYLARLSDNLTELATPEQGMQVFEQLQCVKDEAVYAQFAYARIAAYYQHYDKALNLLDNLLKQDADNAAYLVLKAEVLQQTQRSEEALKLISAAAKKDDASPELRFSYGKLLGEQGKTEQARQVFEDLHQASPENKDVIFALGLLALEDKKPALSKQYFSQLLKLGDPSHQVEYFLGLSEEALGNNDSALVWFASVPAQSRRFDLAQTHYIDLLASKGELDKAREHLALLRKEQPNRAVQFYLLESSFLREHGLDQAAFDLLTQALQRYPDSNDLLYSRAMVSEALNKLDVLEADLRNIIGREPDNAQALNALGYTLTDRTDRHQEALELIQKALEIHPNEPFYLDSLGWAYYRLGDNDKAITYLQQAVNLQPDVEFIAHLGEVLWESGKKQQAIETWREGIKLDSDNPLLLETMRRYGQ